MDSSTVPSSSVKREVAMELPSEPSVKSIREALAKFPESKAKLAADYPPKPPKGVKIADFVKRLDEYEPVIPSAVTEHYMRTCGLETQDPRIVRLLALATEKFIRDVSLDCVMQAKMLSVVPKPKKSKKQKKHSQSQASKTVTITPELLEPVLRDHGIDLNITPYHN